MRALFVNPRWCSSAPLGKPVVPDVYWICTGSSGPTSGSCSVDVPDARNASKSVKAIASRSPGSSLRTVSSDCAIGLPRNSGSRKIPAAPDCSSTYLSSPGLYAGLTVTRVRPASAAPNSTTSHSGMLGAHTATRSPGAKRPSSARAQRSASWSSSPYVQRRRCSGSGCPPISAGWSGAACAASRRIPPTVVSSTGSLWSAG